MLSLIKKLIKVTENKKRVNNKRAELLIPFFSFFIFSSDASFETPTSKPKTENTTRPSTIAINIAYFPNSSGPSHLPAMTLLKKSKPPPNAPPKKDQDKFYINSLIS